MKKGRILVLDQLSDGRSAAALMENGALIDVLVDPHSSDKRPKPQAIYRAKVGRPLKGAGGLFLDLGNGQQAYLKQAGKLAPGEEILVQISASAEEGKAVPVTKRLMIKGEYGILTPASPGVHLARSITSEEERERLNGVARTLAGELAQEDGLILRSSCVQEEEKAILDECRALLAGWRQASGLPGVGLALAAPSAREQALRDWQNPALDDIHDEAGSFDLLGISDLIDKAVSGFVDLGQGAWMQIEPTRALVAVDVNTGGDFSIAAGLKANMAAAKALPKSLRLMGLGGQITIDFAPMAKKNRVALKQVLSGAFNRDQTDTILAGWTPLGHFELQRKKEGFPLAEMWKE